eukprot:TRINITY_DN21979_c0_g1_i1.p1 TRINITY_DN21979_c0_g1~~TRINITY_DN21979_c0_g1_i1.p1  ORF type:complete len:171 (-),score=10.49 TRINITY_DN21979_c0_g1_i1:34-546(-)
MCIRDRRRVHVVNRTYNLDTGNPTIQAVNLIEATSYLIEDLRYFRFYRKRLIKEDLNKFLHLRSNWLSIAPMIVPTRDYMLAVAAIKSDDFYRSFSVLTWMSISAFLLVGVLIYPVYLRQESMLDTNLEVFLRIDNHDTANQLSRLQRIITKFSAPVSYTHLTLPTIYSV